MQIKYNLLKKFPIYKMAHKKHHKSHKKDKDHKKHKHQKNKKQGHKHVCPFAH